MNGGTGSTGVVTRAAAKSAIKCVIAELKSWQINDVQINHTITGDLEFTVPAGVTLLVTKVENHFKALGHMIILVASTYCEDGKSVNDMWDDVCTQLHCA